MSGSIEHPTLEFEQVTAYELDPFGLPEGAMVDPGLLPIQPLEDSTVQILQDEEATGWKQTQVILQEFSRNPDLEQFVLGSPKEVKKILKNAEILLDEQWQQEVTAKTLDYLGMQKTLEAIVTPDFISSIPAPDYRELHKIKDVTERFDKTFDHRREYDKSAAVIETAYLSPGFEEYLGQQKASKSLDEKPIDVRRQIITKVHEKFVEEQERVERRAAAEAQKIAEKEKAERQAELQRQEREQRRVLQQAVRAQAKLEKKASKSQKPLEAKKKEDAKKSKIEEFAQMQIDFDAIENTANEETSSAQAAKSSKGLQLSLDTSQDTVGFSISIAAPKPSKIARKAAEKTSSATQWVQMELANLGDDPKKRVAAIAITAALSSVASSGFLQADKVVHGVLFGDSKSKAGLSLADAEPPDPSDFIKPSVEAKNKLNLAPDSPLTKKEGRQDILEQAKDYAKARLYEVSTKASKVEPSLAEKKDTRPTVSGVDELALYGLELAINNPNITAKQIDRISEWAADAMIAVRHPKIAEQAAPDGGFQNEIAEFLQNGTFKAMPGAEHYTDDQKAVVSALLSKLYGNIAPKADQLNVLDALIAKSAQVNGVLKDAPPTQHKKGASAELKHLNPEVSLATLLAATSIVESGQPANPNAKNWAGCFGYLQYCPPYWTGRAAKYLGDPDAKMTVENQTIVAVKEWTEVLASLDSGGAAMAAWLKGRAVGNAIASRDKAAYDRALRLFDGNGTTVEQYMATIEKYAKKVDVDKQLPFLKGIIKKNPELEKMLDKKYDLYSHYRLRQVKPHTNQVLKDRARREELKKRANQPLKIRPGTNQTAGKGGEYIKGAVDLGMHTAWRGGKKIQTRLYAIQGFKSTGQESHPGAYHIKGAGGNVVVNARMAKNTVAFFREAKYKYDLTFQAVSSTRSHMHQRQLFKRNPNPAEVARPGYSKHQNGTAFDLKGIGPFISTAYPTRYGGPASPSNPRVATGSKIWRVANKIAEKHGLEQYYGEVWHIQLKSK